MSSRGGLLALLAAVTIVGPSCERRAIPPREPAAPVVRSAPTTLLAGGRRVFQDDFERSAIGDRWLVHHDDWRIEGGELHSTAVDNAGVWLAVELPERARIEFSAHSDPLPGGEAFPGDIKCEVFAAAPEHLAGYVVINGGWHNRLDVIARLDEHGADRLEQPAAKVEPGRVYRWAIARADDTLHWFRDGELIASFRDPAPVAGRYFGFNNWRTNVWFDDVAVYELDAPTAAR